VIIVHCSYTKRLIKQFGAQRPLGLCVLVSMKLQLPSVIYMLTRHIKYICPPKNGGNSFLTKGVRDRCIVGELAAYLNSCNSPHRRRLCLLREEPVSPRIILIDHVIVHVFWCEPSSRPSISYPLGICLKDTKHLDIPLILSLPLIPLPCKHCNTPLIIKLYIPAKRHSYYHIK
jgi:hypothetical protein